MVDWKHKGLFYNCDEKYIKGHRCREHKLFHMDVSSLIMVEDLSPEAPSEDDDTKHISPVPNSIELTTSPNEVIISLHALLSILAPQTLKIKGYIKHHPLVVLIDSGNTHNLINRSKDDVIHCFFHPINNFQILIANGCMMKYGGHCDNVKL